MLTFERVHQLLKLDAETGVLTWRVSLSNRAPVGSKAGCVEKRRGYVLVRIDRQLYCAHDVIWLMAHGEWCPGEIDHIDRATGNNRPANLRKATQQQQRMNSSMSTRNTSGHRGVTWDQRARRWQAQVQYCGKNIRLGAFHDKAQAAEAARLKRIELFGEFAPNYDRSATGLTLTHGG